MAAQNAAWCIGGERHFSTRESCPHHRALIQINVEWLPFRPSWLGHAGQGYVSRRRRGQSCDWSR